VLEALCHFAAQTPDKIALEQGEARFSYEALLARAEQMAAALQAAGVAPGDKVGHAGPHPQAIFAQLAVLLAAPSTCPSIPSSRWSVRPYPRLGRSRP
jgi:non-ribosomal peptide synthetase component E (peptide arylation enzyme)